MHVPYYAQGSGCPHWNRCPRPAEGGWPKAQRLQARRAGCQSCCAALYRHGASCPADAACCHAPMTAPAARLPRKIPYPYLAKFPLYTTDTASAVLHRPLQAVAAERLPQASGFRRFIQPHAAQAMRKPGHIRAAAAGNVHNAANARVQGIFHIMARTMSQ